MAAHKPKPQKYPLHPRTHTLSRPDELTLEHLRQDASDALGGGDHFFKLGDKAVSPVSTPTLFEGTGAVVHCLFARLQQGRCYLRLNILPAIVLEVTADIISKPRGAV